MFRMNRKHKPLLTESDGNENYDLQSSNDLRISTSHETNGQALALRISL